MTHENAITRLETFNRGHIIEHLDRMSEEQQKYLYRTFMDAMEKPLLTEIMRRTNGNQTEAARRLGINRATLRAKSKRHGLL